MKIKALFITLFFIAALFSGTALAAERNGNPYGEAAKGETGQSQAQMQQNNQMPSEMHKASDLMGRKVVSQQGQDLGEIKNLVISQNGQVEYIILSRGGFLGMGGKLVPVPWRAADLRIENHKVTAGITKQQLQNAPAFGEDHWSQMSNPGYEQKVNGYFGTQPQSHTQMQPKPNFSKVYPGAGVTANGK